MDKTPVNITPNLIKHFADYLRLELSLSENSVEAYCHDVHLFLQYLEAEKVSTDINAITQETIENFFAYLFDMNIGATSQARILSGLKSFWRYLTQEEIADKDPTLLISSPTLGRHLPEVLSYEEIQKMIDSIDLSQPTGHRNKAMIEEQLSPCTATIVPTRLCKKRSHRSEKPVHCNWRVVPTHRD